MVRDAVLLGVAIVLTLAAGAGLAWFESYGVQRAWRRARINRPGGVALLFGAGVSGLLGGYLDENLFILVAGAVAAISGLSIMRHGGRFSSFLILWVGAIAVVVVLDAEIPAFGVHAADVALTAFVLSCFSAVLREWDAAGPGGWFAGVVTAIGMTSLCVVVDKPDDTALAVLTTGALFGVIAVTAFGAGLLGRVGARFAGLVIGGTAVRAAVGSPGASLAVAVAAGFVFLLWIATFERGYRGRAALLTMAVAGAFAAASVPALLALREVAPPLRRAVVTSRGLTRANPTGDLASVSAKLASAQGTFRRSANKLTRPSVIAGRFVPFFGANLRAATASAESAADLTRSASQLLNQINVSAVSVRDARVQEGELDRLAGALRDVEFAIQRARTDIRAGGRTDLLVPDLREAVDNLGGQLTSVERRIRVSLDGTVAAKRLLGFNGTRRYFVAVQNNAESRATGGYIANYGILVVNNGRITLPEFRRTAEFDNAGAPPRILRASKDFTRRYSSFDVASSWPNVNLSPDFPTVAAIMADQYRQFSGKRVDGVIALDPIALSRLLTLTGPVRVPGWPVPINANNAVRITLHDEYVAFEGRGDERVDFLGRVAKQVFDRLTAVGLSDLKKAGRVARSLTARRNLQFFARDELATKFFAATHADGAAPRPTNSDSLIVTTQNAAANKLDYYLRRRIKYEATVDRSGDTTFIDATVTVQLRNNGPATGEPKYVIGPADSRFKAGQNRLFVSVHSPLESATATLDGQPLELIGAPELGQFAHSAFVDVPAGATRTIEMHLRGRIRRAAAGYALNIFRQPVIGNDVVELLLHGVGPRGQYAQNGPLTRDLRLELPVNN